MADNGKTFATLVPEFFFDVISRIIPGTILILAVCYELKGFAEGGAFEIGRLLGSGVGVATCLLFLLLGVSQAVGLPLSVFGYLFQPLYFKRAWKSLGTKKLEWLRQTLKNVLGLEFPEPANMTNRHFQDLYENTHGYVKQHSAASKTLLPKLSAESALCNNLAAALVVWLVVWLSNCLPEGTAFTEAGWMRLVCFLVGIVLLVFAARTRYRRLLRRQIVLLRNLIPNEPQRNTSIADAFKNIIERHQIELESLVAADARLAEVLTQACTFITTWDVPASQVNLAEVDAIVAFACGLGANNQPGCTNDGLAAFIIAVREKGCQAPIVAQWEVAAALKARGIDVSHEAVTKDDYLTTYDAWMQMKEFTEGGTLGDAVKTILLVAHPDHTFRCMRLIAKSAPQFQIVVPDRNDLLSEMRSKGCDDDGFDAGSIQPWTTSRAGNVKHEIESRFLASREDKI
ncbi:MAG: hypothetical protein HQ567_19785 [Candidatus Nealsonbacteria bacterium]|nr:hypothetical protein [Candidatus Nealsonbacteria bacterium]